MFKEITENTISKAKEEIVLAQWVVVLIAVVSFLTGLVVGILCMTGANHRKNRKAFSADDYVRDLNFDIDDNEYENYDEDEEFDISF